MPSKSSPRMKRPPSPYNVSQSPRARSQQRVWRPLNSTGQANSSNAFADTSREMWLKSLRQGTDVKRSPVKGNHSIHRNLNASMSSTSDYLRDQLGLPNSARNHKRSNSVDLSHSSPRTSTPQFKSPEDMYDEIISLKKMSVAQKNDYDVLKAKTRRLEEENTRKEKYIQQLLDPKASGESIRRLAEGGSKSGSLVTSGLKQRILKLEKQLRDKEQELKIMKSDVKTTDIVEMKTAMEIYYQEVLRLQDCISSQEQKSERLNSSLRSERDAVPSKIKVLRKNVLQLTAENNQLIEDNKRLKRDLDKVIDNIDDTSGDEDEEEIKYSALSRVELVTHIKKIKKSESQKAKANQVRDSEEIDKLRSIVNRVKEEKNELRDENKKLQEQNKCLENDLDKQTDKVSNLRSDIESLKQNAGIHQDERRDETFKERRRSVDGRPKRRPRTADQNKAATSIQRHWREHRSKKLKEEDNIVMLQSAMRGHLSRTERPTSRTSHSHHKMSDGDDDITDEEIITDDSDSDDGVVFLQSAMRGHLERKKGL